MNELYHSDTYLGQDFSDGIRHFKYVKKVPNGKGGWIYYYNTNVFKNGVSGYMSKTKGKANSKYGTYEGGSNNKLIVKKSNKLFSSTKRTTDSKNLGNGLYAINGRTTVRNVGKIEQGVDKVKSKVNKAIKNLKKKKKKKSNDSRITIKTSSNLMYTKPQATITTKRR